MLDGPGHDEIAGGDDVENVNPGGAGSALGVCEHAPNQLPRAARDYHPFHDLVGRLIMKRQAELGRPPAQVTVHSFTPIFHGVPRKVLVGVLHDADSALADRLLAAALSGPGEG